MSVSSFYSKLETVGKEIDSFTYQIEFSQIPLVMGKSTIQSAQGSHNHIFDIYQKLQKNLYDLKLDASKNLAYFQQIELIEKLSPMEEKSKKIMTDFTNLVLTKHPTASIEYGKPCIGPITAPKINTTNPKLIEILSNSTCMRNISGDGNCFLAAFTVRYLENLIQDGNIGKFIDFLSIDGIKVPELKESILETLLYLNEYPSQKENILQNNQKMLPFINYFRQIAAYEMKKKPDDYELYLRSDVEDVYHGKVDNQSFSSLVDQYVLSMGTDFSHPMIAALCKHLNFPVLIFDPKVGGQEGLNVLFQKESKGIFCRSDEHYFVIYSKEEKAPIPVPVLQNPIPVQRNPSELLIKCAIPFGHALFIRGSGNGLSWEKGKPLTQVDAEQWILRLTAPLNDMEFKFVFDDEIWENGNNRKYSNGKVDNAAPEFNLPTAPNLDLNLFAPPPAPITKVLVQYKGKESDKLFLQGTGPGMTWGKGVEMKRIDSDLWIWETQSNFENFEYKLVLNDKGYQIGLNNKIEHGKNQEIIQPDFPIETININPVVPPAPKSKIIVQYKGKEGDKLFLQGTGPGMTWGKGVEMKRVDSNLWSWETESNFENFEYKIVLNDAKYQIGLNNKIEHGKQQEISQVDFPL